MGQSKSNRLWVSIFTVFLFLPFSVFAAPTVEMLNAFVRGSLSKKTDDFFTAAARSSNEGIDLEFNRTLDEILEMKGMDREALPGHILSQLREATRDPMKLIVPEKPGGHPLHYFQDHEHSDVFRAFFQKRLDVNNGDHMEGLMTSVHDMAEETGARVDDILSTLYEYDNFALIPDQVWIENLYASVYSTAMRGVYVNDISPGGKEPFHAFVRRFEEAMESGSADSYIINPHFRLPDAKVDENGYRKMVFEYVAANPERFVGRMADDPQIKEAVSRFWDEDVTMVFRKPVINSIGKDNRHLLSDWEFFLKFWEQAKVLEGGRARLRGLVKASFKNADNAYDVELAKHGDVFWNTTNRASGESAYFFQELDSMLRSIAKEEGRVPSNGMTDGVRQRRTPVAEIDVAEDTPLVSRIMRWFRSGRRGNNEPIIIKRGIQERGIQVLD